MNDGYGMKKEKWLMPTVVVLLVVLLVALVLGAVVLLFCMFPMAEPIQYPELGSVAAISLAENNNDDASVAVEPAKFNTFLQHISNAQPTRIWSVNDYPTAENYYTIEIDTSGRECRYFIYIENAQVYIESPYEGVYKTNQQFLDFVAAFFED